MVHDSNTWNLDHPCTTADISYTWRDCGMLVCLTLSSILVHLYTIRKENQGSVAVTSLRTVVCKELPGQHVTMATGNEPHSKKDGGACYIQVTEQGDGTHTFHAGFLWEERHDAQGGQHTSLGNVLSPTAYQGSLPNQSVTLHCCDLNIDRAIGAIGPTDHVLKEISREEFGLLSAMKQEKTRIAVYADREWMAEGCHLQVGDVVRPIDVPNLSNEARATIRYKGNLDNSRGTWFGLELHHPHKGRGTSSGSFRKICYFTCGLNDALFVTLFRIRQSTPKVAPFAGDRGAPSGEFTPVGCGGGESEAESEAESRGVGDGGRDGVPLPPSDVRDHGNGGNATQVISKVNVVPLTVDERVVWLADSGPEFGTSRWVGYLTDDPHHVYVGVEFDKPIGRGTGRHKGETLFTARPGHASLVPLDGLMKASDFDSSSGWTDVRTSSPVPAAKTRRNDDVSNVVAGTQTMMTSRGIYDSSAVVLPGSEQARYGQRDRYGRSNGAHAAGILPDIPDLLRYNRSTESERPGASDVHRSGMLPQVVEEDGVYPMETDVVDVEDPHGFYTE